MHNTDSIVAFQLSMLREFHEMILLVHYKKLPFLPIIEHLSNLFKVDYLMVHLKSKRGNQWIISCLSSC